jgi:hypothetical protein
MIKIREADRLKIAQRFIAGVAGTNVMSPGRGRMKCFRSRFSVARYAGSVVDIAPYPAPTSSGLG